MSDKSKRPGAPHSGGSPRKPVSASNRGAAAKPVSASSAANTPAASAQSSTPPTVRKKATPPALPSSRRAASVRKGPVTRAAAKNDPFANAKLPFGKRNLQVLLVSIVLLIIGYGMVAIEPYKDAKEFSMALHVSPIFLVAGYVGLAIAVALRPKKGKDVETPVLDTAGDS